MSMSREDVERNQERAVQRKLETGSRMTHDDRRVVQRRMAKAIQRRGTTIPGPVLSASGDTSAVLGKLNSMARGMWGSPPDFNGTPVEAAVNQVLGTNTLRRQSNSFFYESTSGINMNWSGTIRVTVENARPVGGQGTGTTELGGGGTATDTTERSSSTTDSASGTGSWSPNGDQGGAGASATAGTSTTTGNTTGTSDASNGTINQASRDNLQRYTGTLVANLSLRAEVAMSGSDYINPFKWGMAAGEAMAPIAPRSDSVNCGTVTYQMSSGFAPPASGG